MATESPYNIALDKVFVSEDGGGGGGWGGRGEGFGMVGIQYPDKYFYFISKIFL